MTMATYRVPVARRPVHATVSVPGSKSLANRAFVCAALADGVSSITRVAPGDDTLAMVDCLRVLGVGLELENDAQASVTGTGGAFHAEGARLHARLAGTTSRFATALAALGDGPITIDGAPPLRSRPIGPLLEALETLGVVADAVDGAGHLPVEVTGPPTSGSVSIRGDVSSQYVTALMLIGPYLPGGLDLTLTTPLVSRPYVEITAAVMASFGVHEVDVGEGRIVVAPGRYTSCQYAIEPDASSASYALALVAVVGGEVTVEGLGDRSLQGDARFVDVMESMGCQASSTHTSVMVRRDPRTPLTGVDIDMADISDLVPTVAAVAVLANSPTTIRGVSFIRGKESDRLGDLSRELCRTGARVTETVDGLYIEPAGRRLTGGVLETHHDHRLAMAFGVLGTAVEGIVVVDPGVVSKSWPNFWEALDEIVREELAT